MAAGAQEAVGYGSGAPNRMGSALLAAMLAMVGLITLMSGLASAALTHSTIEKTFPIGAVGECVNGQEVAVDESAELIYAICNRSDPVIKRFHFDGTAAPFGASAPYIVGNVIVGNPNSPENTWDGHSFSDSTMPIAVDNSSVNNGYLYVSGGCPACALNNINAQKVEVFTRSGEWFKELQAKPNEGRAIDVSVGPDGAVYVANEGGQGGKIRKYDGASLNEVRRLFPGKVSDFVRPDSTGAVWAGWTTPLENSGGPTELVKWEADQFSTNLSTTRAEAFVNSLPEVPFSPFVSATGLLPNVKNPTAIDVDVTTDDLYVDTGNKITPYTGGDAEELVHQSAPIIGSGTLAGSQGIDVTNDGRVFATNGSSVVIFGPGDIVPDVRTPAPEIDDIGHTSATLRAHIDRADGTPVTGCTIEYGTTISYGVEAPCSPDPSSSPPGSNFTASTTDVSATPTSLTTGVTYHYRFRAANEKGVNFGGDRTFVPAFVIKLHTEAATEIDTHAATLNGSFDPDGKETFYFFEYGADTKYGQNSPVALVGSTPGKVDVATTIEDLPSGRTFHYRLVAANVDGTTKGVDRTFRTASAPDISGVRATDIRAASATLNARIDPVGYETTYRFEYGPTPAYGSSIPVPDESIGSGNTPVAVSQQIEGLQQGVTYHFRIVAENDWGTGASDDTTFDFSPPACPNEHARQQSGSSYLPDCRAYELVSPRNAGSVFFFPSGMLRIQAFSTIPGFHLWPVNRGTATDPSRFTYFGALGSPSDVFAPNSLLDMYMATRTTTGWLPSVPALQGNEVLFAGEKQCSDALDLCLDHVAQDGVYGEFDGESAPYLLTAAGKLIGQLPTNVKVVKDGKTFVGDQRPSYDFSHFVFSSRTAVFTPDGLPGSATYPGSAYDNDIGEKTVSLISKLPSGEPIPADVGGTEFIQFPGISTDGSHILMSIKGSGGPSHLYMRVNGSVTYDVSGTGVTFVGMTRSGSTVYFTATQQLTPDDTDTGADLYMWSEAGNSLTRVSQGNGNGDTDSCTATWVAKCGVAPLTTEMENPFKLISVPGLDDRIARESGDAYFYSPELLDSGSPGVANQRNLYVYREGSVRLVASFEPGTQVNRMQVSPDGNHAGVVTASRLTGYDSKGFKEMYTYAADSGAIRCASCRPDGIAPTVSVEASQGGPFMSDDGRVFFVTRDSLVPQDTNGSIGDVYEFVAGRPQLISSGTGFRDITAGGAFFPPVPIGLEAVSGDGLDVYFSTFDTLVPEDENGPFVKFYDARTGGGFDFEYHIAPCEAADECHGADSSAPPAPTIGTSGNLGGTGNARPQARRKRTKSGERHRKRHRRHRNGRAGRSHGNLRHSHG